jgi:hypothetical protein
MFVSPAKPVNVFYCLLVISACCFSFFSCTVKDYPNKPFVYATNINIEGKYSAEEKKILKIQLEQQLHDSLRVRWERKFLVAKVFKNPPVYDSANVVLSERYMGVMLNSLGYYRDSISFTHKVDTVRKQQRTTVNFNLVPGKLIKIDSLWYNLLDSVAYMPEIDTLQQLTINSMNERVLHKGDPFSKYLISSELDRLADLARNNGYLKFTKEQLLAVWDTVGLALLRPATDISEQLKLLELIRQRRENPTVDLEIRLNPNIDTTRLTRYYIGQVTIYPDTDIDTAENAYYTPKIETLTKNQYQFISYQGLFLPRKLLRFIYLHRGDLYTQTNYFRTQNRFSALPAWRLVTITQLPRPGQDTVDFEIRLVPAKHYTQSVTFDVSKNQGNLGSEGNLLGMGINFSLVNKNFAKAANQALTNLRYGIELTSKIDSVQTQQLILSHTIQFPRLVPRLTWIAPEWRENGQTFLSFNLGFTDRIKYYRVFSLNSSWGYEFSHNKTIIGFRFPNIEYNFLERRPLLDGLIQTNQSYQYIFNDGLIVSGLVNFNIAGGRKNLTTAKKISVELAGLPGVLHSVAPEAKLYHFVKVDGEYSQTYKIGAAKRSAFAWRIFGGIGYGIPFSNKDGTPDKLNFYMPFFRQYYAGGPSSMRAWSLRKLGPGSAIKSFARDVAPDRFGDMRLEFNSEYRFYITQLVGFPMEGALFTDIGNVWFVRKNPDFVGGEFRPDRLWKDIAIGVGTGVRIDFDFLLARFDFAWKAKDPSPEDPAAQNKWFYKWRPGFKSKYGAQFQLGINYPF